MKYDYYGKSKSEIIKNYEKFEDKIIINFLDGSSQEVLLKDETEDEILNKMLGQAKERNISPTLKEIVDYRRHYLLQEICNIFLSLSSTLRAMKSNITNNNLSLILSSILAFGFALLAVINGKEFKIHNDELKDIKKYAIYLYLLKKLEEINLMNNNLLKINGNELNINTIDNYTLKDIIKLRNTIINDENYAKYFSDKESIITLTKKINRIFILIL